MVLAVVAYLLVTWASVYVVEIADVGGAGEALLAHSAMPLWVHLFHEGHFTEILQWASLGAAALVVGHVSGRLRGEGDDRLGAFSLLLSVALLVMLIEDTGDFRHTLSNYGEGMLGIPGLYSNFVILALIAAVPLYAVARHWHHVWALRPFRGYLAAAFVAYGLGGAMSATGPLWYERAGAWLQDRLFAGALPRWDGAASPHEYLIFDFMVEESAELLGAALFLAAVLEFARVRRHVPRV